VNWQAPDQVMTAILGELHNLLNAEPKARPKDVEQRVTALLAEAEANAAWSDWKAAVCNTVPRIAWPATTSAAPPTISRKHSMPPPKTALVP
jgi:hypothetical protein